jgi:exonuclease III
MIPSSIHTAIPAPPSRIYHKFVSLIPRSLTLYSLQLHLPLHRTSIAHINLNSLTKKFHDLSALLTHRDIDIMCITETRLKVESKLSEIIGFQTFRRDATSSSERGVAIICKSNLTTRIHDLSQILPVNPSIEYLVLSIQYEKTKSFFVVVIYRHPNYLKEERDNDYNFFQTLISSLVETTKKFFILGDFNLRDDHSYHPLGRIITTNNCYQVIEEPTRLNKKLDLIIINDLSSLVRTSVYQPHLSDHCLTQILIRIPKVLRKKITIQYRDFKNIDVVGMRTHLHSVDKSTFCCELDDPFGITTSIITSCFNIFAPKKVISIVQYPYRKYIAPSTKSLIKQRDRLYETEKRFNVHSEELLGGYAGTRR